MIEAGGQLLLSNLWAEYARIIPHEEWALIGGEGWDEVLTGYEALSIINDLLKIIEKTLRGARTRTPPYVSWLRVTEVED